MYESIAGIEFQGAAFRQRTKMTFFKNEKNRICLIYGKNGSGKSTISRAVQKIKGCDYPQITDAKYIDKDGNEVTVKEENQDHIFVFNEDYIEKNVRVKEDGLSTIVLLGDQGDLDDKIECAKTEFESAKKKLEIEEETHNKYIDDTSIHSPDYYIGKMINALKGDGYWAGRERLITNRRQNASVSCTTYKKIINSQPEAPKEEIEQQFNDGMRMLELAADEGNRITTHVQTTVTLKSTEEKILELLSFKIEKPELTERERYLMMLIEQGQTSVLDEMKNHFSEKSISQCPFCLQPITQKYKDGLIESIEKVLSKIADEHRAVLSQIRMSEIIIDLDPFQKLDDSLIERCELAIKELNETIAECNKYINQKLDSLYTPIMNVGFNLEEKRTMLEDVLAELEANREKYNSQFDEIGKTKVLLQRLNRELSYYDIFDLYKEYLKKIEEKKKEEKRLFDLAEIEKEKKSEYNDLLQQKKSIKIAVDVINEGLQYVFFSKNRLHIEVNDNIYSLTTNGNAIRPSDVSSRERNIIALCYFFVDIMNNLPSDKAYAQECLLIIDDPVSSFDLENRIGILSFLKTQLLKLFCGNAESKAVIMTHDLPTFYDIEKILGEVQDAASAKFGNNKNMYSLQELTKRNLLEFKEKKRHEYTELISAVYNYAASLSDEYDMVIGNVMRRMLEAFSTFEYKQGIAKISCDETILDSLGNKTYRDYFQNLMYRLLLNGESHMEESVKSLTDPTFASYISLEEKRRTAKDILCFVALLNKAHVEAHLKAIPTAMASIDDWCNQILQDNG